MSDLIKAVTASTATLLGTSPFLVGDVCAAHIVAGGTIYGVNHPGQNPLRQGITGGIDSSVHSSQKFLRLTLDGSTVSFTEDDYPALANAHDDSGSLTDANRLRIVAREVGVGGTVTGLLKRVQSDTSGGAASGEFLVKDDTGTMTLEIGDAGSDGEILELWLLDAADIDSTTVTAALPTELECSDVIVATGAARLVGQWK